LVKASERIPHALLVHEAEALGYPLWLIRLAIATYKLQRVLRVGTAVSSIVEAMRGITAESTLATTEMRLAMVRIVDRAVTFSPATAFTLFVDDLGIELTGGPRWVEKQLAAVTLMICDAITAAGMEVSKTKSVVLANCSSLGRGLEGRLAKYGVKLVGRAKSLGAGMGAGVVGNGLVLKKRMKSFAKRARRFRLLRRSGVDTARVRIGGLSSLTYGAEALGVSDSTLLNQRRLVAAAAVAPSSAGGVRTWILRWSWLTGG
jgi:hypothetical protein